jgi:hypothetical protein
MIIQADDAGATAEQLVRHETYHALEKFSVGAGFKPAQNGEGGSNGTRAALKPAPTMLHHQKGDKFMTG